MRKCTVVLTIVLTGLFMPLFSQAAGVTFETAHLIVNDGTDILSPEQLKALAEQAQATLENILGFWSVDPGIDRFGKIRVIFERPRRDVYSSVFYWDTKGGKKTRVVGVFGTDEKPQMMAHKLTSAIFPQRDKLIRNMMGILTEEQVGNPLTFPMCGYSSDDWVLAILKAKSYIPIDELGPDHESWGMKDEGKGRLKITDKAKQHKGYAEAGSFGTYLFQTYGINKMKQFHRLSHEKDRPWQDVFRVGIKELEANWINALKAYEKTRQGNISLLLKLLDSHPDTACLEGQKLSAKKP